MSRQCSPAELRAHPPRLARFLPPTRYRRKLSQPLKPTSAAHPPTIAVVAPSPGRPPLSLNADKVCPSFAAMPLYIKDRASQQAVREPAALTSEPSQRPRGAPRKSGSSAVAEARQPEASPLNSWPSASARRTRSWVTTSMACQPDGSSTHRPWSRFCRAKPLAHVSPPQLRLARCVCCPQQTFWKHRSSSRRSRGRPGNANSTCWCIAPGSTSSRSIATRPRPPGRHRAASARAATRTRLRHPGSLTSVPSNRPTSFAA
jgi:hypothetical protein